MVCMIVNEIVLCIEMEIQMTWSHFTVQSDYFLSIPSLFSSMFTMLINLEYQICKVLSL